MTIPRPADAHGSSMTFGSFMATVNQISISAPAMKRAAIDATHLGTVGAMDSVPAALVDAGEVSVDCEFLPSALPPIQDAAGPLTILFNATTPNTWTWANAFCTGAKLPAVKSGDKLTQTLTFKLNSIPTIS